MLCNLKTTEERKLALDLLVERKQKSSTIKKIDNILLKAGSPMYYYCHLCGLLAEKLSEDHQCSPKQYCDECQPLIDAGWSDDQQRFIEYISVTCSTCNGSGKTSWNDFYTKRPRNCTSCHGRGFFKKENPVDVIT